MIRIRNDSRLFKVDRQDELALIPLGLPDFCGLIGNLLGTSNTVPSIFYPLLLSTRFGRKVTLAVEDKEIFASEHFHFDLPQSLIRRGVPRVIAEAILTTHL